MASLISFLLFITFFGILGMVLACVPFKKVYTSLLKLKQRKNIRTFPNVKSKRHEPNLRNTDLLNLNLNTHLKSQFSPEKNFSRTEDAFTVLYLLAPSDAHYQGILVWRTLIEHGLIYGKMRIFHAYDSNSDFKQKVLFSVAGATEPGYLDKAHIEKTSVSGLCFFIHNHASPRIIQNFKKMLQTAHHIHESLGGMLCNHQQQPLSKAMLDQYQKTLSSSFFI